LLKIKRNERVAAMTRYLCSHPNQIFTLNHFSELFQSAKSTVCEDIAIIRDTFLEFHLGDLESIAGAGGGVRFVPLPHKEETAAFLRDLCVTLSEPDRMLPGGYIYMNDILYTPQYIRQIGEILASRFLERKPDFVITVETKGTPVAIMTALSLGCPVVAARRDNNVTEGPLVSINYVTASSRRIQTMSLSKRAVKKGEKALIVDDFMKGGGTAKGIKELLKEFDVEIVGTGVVIATREPKDKLIADYTPLVILEQVDEAGRSIKLSPAEWVL
jgi:purine operon repressor